MFHKNECKGGDWKTCTKCPGKIGDTEKYAFPLLSLDVYHRQLTLCNYSYVWYGTNQFNFETGTLLDQPRAPKATFKFLNRQNSIIWSTPINWYDWQNFAITIDFVKK